MKKISYKTGFVLTAATALAFGSVAPGYASAQATNPWALKTAPAKPTVEAIPETPAPAASRYAPADLDAQLSSGGQVAAPAAIVTPQQQPAAQVPVQPLTNSTPTYAPNPPISGTYGQGYGYSAGQPGYPYAPGFGNGSFGPNYGGFPGSYGQNSPFGSYGNSSGNNGMWPSGGNFPSFGSPFNGISPFGFF